MIPNRHTCRAATARLIAATLVALATVFSTPNTHSQTARLRAGFEVEYENFSGISLGGAIAAHPTLPDTFYAVTGFHGLHVLSGVIYLICIYIKAAKGAYTQGGMSYSPVELVGLFWHFVDLVWILVFTFVYLL